MRGTLLIDGHSSTRHRRGLVIGKFYPPHRGHSYLIETGLAQTEELHVIVCGREAEGPKGDLRAAWIREMHPRARVLLINDTLDPEDSAAWAKHTVEWLGFCPDVVFTSEDYGPRFAACLGCRHVPVDPTRAKVPVSGTAVRADPFGNWRFLGPPVRAFYARRICIVGAESTGKSTLAADLAQHYGTVWVPEYGREHAERMLTEHEEYRWATEDFTAIARRQCERENAAARDANRILICDTDAFATGIWHRRYLGEAGPEVEAIAAGHRRPALYLIPDVDTPFVQDGTRDGEEIRRWMHAAFLTALEQDGRSYVQLQGPFRERFRQAVAAIDGLQPQIRTLPQNGVDTKKGGKPGHRK